MQRLLLVSGTPRRRGAKSFLLPSVCGRKGRKERRREGKKDGIKRKGRKRGRE